MGNLSYLSTKRHSETVLGLKADLKFAQSFRTIRQIFAITSSFSHSEYNFISLYHIGANQFQPPCSHHYVLIIAENSIL